MERLNLIKVKAFAVEADDDERSSSIHGYYKDKHIAAVDTKEVGWYGSDGRVLDVELFEDEEGNLYDAKSLGKYKDIEREYKDKTIASIKSKLTAEELILLGIK